MNSLAAQIHAANEELIAKGNIDAIGDYFLPEYVVHVTDRDIPGGHETIRKILGMLARAFPSIDVEVEILVEGHDRIAWQRTLRAKHEGSYQGFPGTGRLLVWRDMITSRFEDGRIAEEWFLTDLAEQLLLERKG